jgi:membrane protein
MSEKVTGKAEDVWQRATEALGPAEEPVRLTGDVVYQSIKDLLVDDGPQWAAAIAYYALLSFLPLVLVGAVAASFFVDPDWAVDRTAPLLGNVLPYGDDEVEQIVEEAVGARNQLGWLAIAGLLWSGTRVFMALTRSLNIAFDTDHDYGFFHRLGVEVLMLLTLGMFFIFALASGQLTSELWSAVNVLPGDDGMLYEWITRAVRAAFLLLAYFLLYRLVPRGNHPWKASLIGAAAATALFMIASPLFQYYQTQFGEQEVVYGSLAILVIVLIWVWLVALITLFGGELAAHVEAMVFQGKSRQEVDGAHRERARPKNKQSRPSSDSA